MTDPVTAASGIASKTLRVVPLPTSHSTGRTVVRLASDLRISYSGPDFTEETAPGDLKRAVERTTAHVQSTRLEYLSPSRGAEFFDGKGTPSSDVPVIQQVILELESRLFDGTEGAPGEVSSIKSCVQRPAEEHTALEAYALSVPVDGPARIIASSTLGLLRGLATFEQLFYYLPSSNGNATLYAPFAPYEITDKPAFGWRGLMLDTSRNCFGLNAIQKLLDTMSLVKLNVFHWHITDSNSWPLDLNKYPELAAKGAYSDAQRYTESDVRELIDFAAERGIDVVLEVDTPGHTASIAASHPEHIASPGKTPFNDYAHQPPAGQLRFATDKTVQWTKGLFEELVKLGEGKYLGSGGDEVNERCMTEDPVTQASLREKGWTLNQALDAITKEVHAPIHTAGKIPVVWQEMALAHDEMPSLSRDAVVHIWQSSDDAKRVLEKGFKIVHAPADFFYLDAGQGGWIATEHGSNSWCDPYKTWSRMLSFNPYACLTGDSDARKEKVLGGQACLWAEQTDETNLEPVVWPRTAAVAELFWTGDKAGGGYPRNTVEALPRMHDIRYRMVDRGVRAVPLQPHWCALRPELSYEGA